MRALTFLGPETIACETRPDPDLEDPRDIVVEVEWTAICGSDLHVYLGREQGLDPGTVMGHELVGRVAAAGSEVATLTVGNRVVLPFTTSCGACFYCGRGLTARCDRGELLGWVSEGVGLQGAQAERVRIPLADASAVAVPDELDPALALLAGDVLGTALFAADLAAVGAGDLVAVLGCGAVGILAVAAAREAGAERVLAVDPVASRRQLAAEFGAVAASPEDAGPWLEAASQGRGADAVIEAVGSEAATRLAYRLVRPGGTIAAVGVHSEAHLAVSPNQLYDKNVTYRAGRSSARRFLEPALDLLLRARYPVQRLITHRLPLAEGPSAYAAFAAREPGWLKVLLHP